MTTTPKSPLPDPAPAPPSPAPGVPVRDPAPFTPAEEPVPSYQAEALKTGRPPPRQAEDGKTGGLQHKGIPGEPNDPGSGGEAAAPGHDGPGTLPQGGA